jgi:hypothetical protein
MRRDILMAFSLIAVLSFLALSNGSETMTAREASEGQSQVHYGTILKIMQSDNKSTYKNEIGLAWNQYTGYSKYSAKTLDEFLKRNISSNEAMYTLTSLYVLQSKAIDDVNRLKPPKEYADYHNNTLNAMAYLREYLWDIAMYCETRERYYAIQGLGNYNQSVKFAEKVSEDAFFLK